MESRQYIALATKTESVPTELKINQTVLHAAFMLAIATANVMGQVKRRLFYGSPLDIKNLEQHLHTAHQMVVYINSIVRHVEEGAELEQSEANQPLSQEALDSLEMPEDIAGMNLANLNIRLIHSALGGFTESGEKLEVLLKQYEGKGLDLFGYREENGDTQWYDAIEIDELMKLAAEAGLNPIDFSEAGSRITNITKLQGNPKLKGRYSEGDFNIVDALNRDLANERKILEGSELQVISVGEVGNVADVLGKAA
jgi:hypothetical protein